MGLRDEITTDIAEAFDDDLADAVSAFTGTRTGVGTWDPVTETWTATTENYSGRGVFGSFEAAMVDGIQILATDEKLTALQAEVIDSNGAAFAPKVDDTINGKKVLAVGQDAARVSWSLQLRKM